MIQYLYTLPILLASILCMLFLICTNENMLAEHKKGFAVAFAGSCFIVVCEVLSILLNGSSPGLKAIHFLSNYFGFLLTPILVAFFGASIGRFRRIKATFIGMFAYFILCNVLILTKRLFIIDAQNNYQRGSLFFLYIVFYFAAVIYLLYETLQHSHQGFLQHKLFAYLLSVCFLFSSTIQVFKADIYTTRIAVVFCLCIYYTYNVELTNLFDKLTGVLNQGTYIRKIKELKEQQTVIILDIDNFKKINDNYGHQYGNKCLVIIGKALKSTFENRGQCYRIGGDEFAVVLKKNYNAERLIARLENTITDKFKDEPYPVSVSIGYSLCEKNDRAEAVAQRADFHMYHAKKQKRALSEKVFEKQ